MKTTINHLSKMLFAFVLCVGLGMTSCETADPENSESPENPETPEMPTNIIVFADDIVKKSCVEAFDTDGDGEVSYDEAAAVKDLSNVTLRFVEDFLTFDEFQYFTKVKSLPKKFFEGGKCLKSIVLPQGLKTIGGSAFKDCTSLESIVLPEGLETIEKNAFWQCTSLAEVDFPEVLDTLGRDAFKFCTSLTEVELPEGLESIGNQFDCCTNLKKIKFSIGLKWIEQQAFDECRKLAEVHFPDGLKGIYDAAFQYSNLNRVYCASTNPPHLMSMGFRCKTLYVPKNSVELYKSKPTWRDQCENIVGYDF